MHIFITGVAGFLGSHLADHMIKRGHIVSGNDNLVGGYRENINPNVNFWQIDCLDLNAMTRAMTSTDLVIHTAALAHDGYSMFSPTAISQNILQATVATVTAAINSGVRKFVYCSSMARYGNQKTPFTEDMPAKPITPYGVSKVAAEDILKILCNTHGMEWSIVVPHNIIGPRQKYNDPYRNIVSIVINRILLNKKPVIYGDGTQQRSFSYIDDCVDCIDNVVHCNVANSEIYNIGPDVEITTINNVVDYITKKMGYAGGIEYLPRRVSEVEIASCSSNKIKSTFHWKEKFNLEYGIDKTIEYIVSKGAKDFDYSINLEIENHLTPKVWFKHGNFR